jgi:hypothetical protein
MEIGADGSLSLRSGGTAAQFDVVRPEVTNKMKGRISERNYKIQSN